MRTINLYIFSGLAIVSFAIFVVTLLPNISLSEDAVQFVTYTALVWLAKRLWLARDLIGRIILGLVLVITVILIVTVPELQQLVLSWLQGLAEHPLIATVLCLIVCGSCCSRPGTRSS